MNKKLTEKNFTIQGARSDTNYAALRLHRTAWSFAAQVEAKLAMSSKRKELNCALLKGIGTGDAAAVAVVNEEKYIQHNPQAHGGREGLAALFELMSKTSPSVKVVHVFVDGIAVEHWGNIQQRQGSNPSGHTYGR